MPLGKGKTSMKHELFCSMLLFLPELWFSKNGGVRFEKMVTCIFFIEFGKIYVVIHIFFEEKKSFPFRLPGAKSSFFETILGGTLSG